MFSFLTGLTEALSPGTLDAPSHNDGYVGREFKLGSWAVLRPANYPYEPFLLAAVVGYIVLYFVGRAWNQRIASAWMKDALPTLKEQFLALSPNPEQPGSFPLVEDGGSTFLSYASGRRGVMSLHSTIDLIPRQDPLSYIYRTFLYPLWDVKAETPSDTLTLSLALLPPGSTVANSKSYSLHIPGSPADKGDGLPTGVWAVLQKAGMDRVRKSRWDLSFPRVVADSLSGVDRELAVLAEHADVTKAVLGSGTGLRELLDDVEARKYLKNYIISDIPIVRPAKTLPFPSPLTLTLKLALPLPAHLTTAYLRMLVNTVDVLLPPPAASGAKSGLGSAALTPLLDISPDVGRKFRRTRVEAWAIVEKLKREYDEAREKETTGKSKTERVEEERLKKKKEAREALSAKERAKLEEKEKRKAMLKQQKKLQKK